MAWTAPRTWVSLEKVTAALMNTHLRDNIDFLAGTAGDITVDLLSGFTNTSYADLDATTSDTIEAVSVTLTTGTSAVVIVSASVLRINTSGDAFLAYRVSGASTIAAADTRAARNEGTEDVSTTFIDFQDGLTAGSNTFELQARVTGNSGVMRTPSITVIPLV